MKRTFTKILFLAAITMALSASLASSAAAIDQVPLPPCTWSWCAK